MNYSEQVERMLRDLGFSESEIKEKMAIFNPQEKFTLTLTRDEAKALSLGWAVLAAVVLENKLAEKLLLSKFKDYKAIDSFTAKVDELCGQLEIIKKEDKDALRRLVE